MKIALFITIWTAQISPADLRRHFVDQPLAFLTAVPAVVSVDLFVPEPGDVAQFDDPASPALIVQINVNSASDAEALIQTDDFQRLIMDKSAYPAPVEKLALDVFEIVNYPIPGHETPPPRTASLSFVVRYYGPTEDAAAFAKFYTENHPQILAMFPGIRNVLCYLPLDWRSTKKVSDSSTILGNEVVFDDFDALNRALQSDVLDRVKEDGKSFAEFGYNTHYAMHRERLIGPDQ